jgi:hypothetical protein
LDVDGNGNAVNSCTVCRNPECLICKGEDGAAMDNRMRVALSFGIHNHPGISISGFSDYHAKRTGKVALIKNGDLSLSHRSIQARW